MRKAVISIAFFAMGLAPIISHAQSPRNPCPNTPLVSDAIKYVWHTHQVPIIYHSSAVPVQTMDYIPGSKERGLSIVAACFVMFQFSNDRTEPFRQGYLAFEVDLNNTKRYGFFWSPTE